MGNAMYVGIETLFPTTTAGLNILAVDDEAGSRASLAAVLRLAGHHAVFAKDGDEALEIFEHSGELFDMIITDHQMCRVSGLDLVRELRKRKFAGDIVVLTAYAGTLEEEEYKKLEIAGIMEKPFDITEMREWLRCIVAARKHAAPGAINFCCVRRAPDEVNLNRRF